MEQMKTDLSVVLAMLVKEYGGELRISAQTIENGIEPDRVLAIWADQAAQQWVIELEEITTESNDEQHDV